MSFFALTVLSELCRRMREPMYETKSNGEEVRYKPVCDEMSLQKLMNRLDSIKESYDRMAEDVRLAEVTERQCLVSQASEVRRSLRLSARVRKKNLIFPPVRSCVVCRRKN